MSQETPIEGRAGVSRVEAFSDGVLAIIITIMVLELHAPDEVGLAALLHLWTTFFAYVISYNYIAIYWVNHHRLFSHARGVSNGLIWSNMVLLFALSLIPFSTAYLGKHLGDPLVSALYATSLLAPSLAYFWLLTTIRLSGSQSTASRIYFQATTRKGLVAAIIYALAIPVSIFAPYAGITMAGLVGVFWILPWSPVDGLFVGKDDCEKV